MCHGFEPRDRSARDADPDDEAEREDAGYERGERRSRKERILHTRISEDLAEDLRRVAEDLRVPVSNLVRNVLEEAFSVVETVTGNVGDLIEEVMGEAEAVRDRMRGRRHRHGRHRHRARRHGSETRSAAEESREAASDPAAPAEAAAADVLGWQPLVLARPQRCERCETLLGRGDSAYASVTSQGVGKSWRCEDCIAD
jgi:hypothetical protein